MEVDLSEESFRGQDKRTIPYEKWPTIVQLSLEIMIIDNSILKYKESIKKTQKQLYGETSIWS